MKDHEIACIQRTDHTQVHERIKVIGGIDPADGKRWKLSQGEAIMAIEGGRASFHVKVRGNAVLVVAATSAWGIKYLKTTADNEQPNTLLALPECPYF